MTTRTPMPRPRMLGIALAALALLTGALAGTARAADPPTVYAAASLSDAFPRILPSARFSFAGSNTLALQIRRGAPADVFASASPRFTRELYRDGLVEKPRPLAFNRLVVVVPRDNPAEIRSVYDLRRDDIKLVVAGPQVPVGAYTLTVLRNLGLTGVLDNVVSREQDVRDVLGKVALGQADAGFVYATDARVAATRLRTIPIPASAQPTVRLEIAVVRGSRNRAAARAFVTRATGPPGRRALVAAGFRVPAPRTPPVRR